ncbi:MAG: ATP synthase F1 subunit gamma [bacterium]
MIASLRQLKSRIRSIENVKKVTHAMEMISLSKVKPMQNRLLDGRRYFRETEKLLKHLLATADGASHPLTEDRPHKDKTALCLVTSDTGLCSSYNHSILDEAEEFIHKYGPGNIILEAVGRKGLNYFKKRGVKVAHSHIELNSRYSDGLARGILKNLTELFLSREVDEVYLAYTRFESPSRHKPVIEKLFNIEWDRTDKKSANELYIFEPGLDAILDQLIPLCLFNKIKSMLLESFVSEHSARMIAMGEATHNARELLEGLVLMRNKVRQANITREIMEIISSAEVLR